MSPGDPEKTTVGRVARNEGTEAVRGVYDRLAPRYDTMIAFWERVLFSGGREWVCERTSGETLELAVGTARNLPLYPDHVRLTGIDVSEPMLKLARRRAEEVGREVALRVADAQGLPFEDASFDTVVSTLSMCSIPDPRRAATESFRVLRPGGRIVLLDHVRSPLWPIRAGQRLLEPLFVRLMGDHLLREPLEDLSAVGFQVEEVERHRLGIVERLSARKPGDAQGGGGP